MSEPQPRSPDFRPSPTRSVYVSGELGPATLEKLTPQVLALQAQSRAPITVFIDSPGGATYYGELLYRLLAAGDQDGSPSCRIITVAVGTAASAAADLLIGGDYAIAYSHCTLLCHGVRQTPGSALTRERVMTLAKTLATSNEQFALALARNAISRFMLRFVIQRPQFGAIRQQTTVEDTSEILYFTESLVTHLPTYLLRLLSDARTKSMQLDSMNASVSATFTASGQDLNTLRAAEFEALLLRGIIEWEVATNTDEGWSLRATGFERIEEDFSLLIDKFNERHLSQINMLCERWGEFLLSAEQEAQFRTIAHPERSAWLLEKVSGQVTQLWFFFVSLCRLLQKDDYYLTAEEAYWLGLIDEVIGRADLPCARMMVEHAPE